jgi:hypothetical protein
MHKTRESPFIPAHRYFQLRRANGLCAIVYFKNKGTSLPGPCTWPFFIVCFLQSHQFISDDTSASAAKGIVALDKTATVKRTKNVRDGFEFCIRVDAPNAGSSMLTGVKRWTKLVMVLRNEPDMVSWIQTIRSGISGGQITVASRLTFDSSQPRTDDMVVFQGNALKEVRLWNVFVLKILYFLLCSDVSHAIVTCSRCIGTHNWIFHD